MSRSESCLTGTLRTVLGALALRFHVLGGDAYPVCGPSRAGGIPWARAGESIKENIGNAVAPNGSPEGVLGKIAQDARAAKDAE
ncbi:hypothetical protein ACFRQM_20025 [Streptomyces sp. NPDC056831]|uniref:hypothetical protein n=1 Tax=Streptomyces sp. NPDC056831 TaxID=3345954 RepID=UPI0036AB0A98